MPYLSLRRHSLLLDLLRHDEYLGTGHHPWGWLEAIHIAGSKNYRAHALNRMKSSDHKWSFPLDNLLPIFEYWDTPAVDLFATRNNTKAESSASGQGVTLG